MTDSPPPAAPRLIATDQALRLAHEHHAAGRRAPAEALLQQIVHATPHHADAWELLAIIAHEAGQPAQAIERMDKAIGARPLSGQLHANRAEMHRQLGQLEQALADGQRAVALDPANAAAHSNLGIAWYDSNDLAQAEACQHQALALAPAYAPALNNLGSICRDRRDRAAAAEWYRKALAAEPDYLEARNNLGALLVEMDDPEAGIGELLQVLRARPDQADAHCNIGHACMALEDYSRAERAFGAALALQPDFAEACEGLARSYRETRRPELAEQFAQRALAMRERPATWTLLGHVYAEQSFPDRAGAAFDRAIALKPDFTGAWLGKGHLMMELGRLQEAEQHFRHAHDLDPQALAPRLALTQVRKTREDDPNFIALQEIGRQAEALPATRAISLHFALGKAYDDLKRPHDAFPHFSEGCRLKRARIDYDPEVNHRSSRAVREVFTPERIAALRGAGDPSPVPIFVLGMPRSGTTLTETIIASHPAVHGAGELPDLMRLLGRGRAPSAQGYPLNVEDLDRHDLSRLGAQYVRQLRERAPDAARITDKMPVNFLGLGMIHLMLPNAKIIHVRRNPVDTCLSAFCKLFNNSLYYTYDLRELGRYYRDYLAVMAHWRQVLPPDAFHEVQYEDLVTRQEEESRKLIAYCGLDWDDACLTPHKAERAVKTASITQVRQPVYTSSVERWRAYEQYLGPLLEELDAGLQPLP